MENIRPYLKFFSLLIVLVGIAESVSGFPSGGPYGPVARCYEVPQDAGRVFYVSPDGKNRDSGESIDKPTTLDSAIRQVRTGDAIVLRGGTYRTGDLKFNQGIIMQPYMDEQVVLKGSELATDWKPAGKDLWKTSWQKLFPAQPESWWRREKHEASTPLYWFNNDMVFIDGVLLRPVGGQGDVGDDSYFIDYDAGEVYIGTNPEGLVVEITAQDNALTRMITRVHGKESDSKGPIIRGIHFSQYAFRAIEISGNDPEKPADPETFGKDVVGTVLENISITYCSRVGGYLRGDNLIVRNCLVSDTETEGLFIFASSDVLLERNVFKRNNVQNMKGYYPAAVKIFNQTYRMVCRDNHVLENPNSSGIWYDVGNVDGVFVDNLIKDCTDGIFFEISKGITVAGNVFIDCEKGIRSLNSSGLIATNNTLINSMAAFERTTRSALGDHFGWHPATGPDVHERDGHVFVNNLLVADESYRRELLYAHQVEELCGKLTEPPFTALGSNVYVRARDIGESLFIHMSPLDKNVCYAESGSLVEFKSLGSGYGYGSREWVGYDGPVFRDASNYDFRLNPGFPGVELNAGAYPSKN
jgi:parallel beta-helix repeat protein